MDELDELLSDLSDTLGGRAAPSRAAAASSSTASHHPVR